MYQVSSKTGMRHAIEADMPRNLDALEMLKGNSLPVAKCGRQIQPVNFYTPENRTKIRRYECSRCFDQL